MLAHRLCDKNFLLKFAQSLADQQCKKEGLRPLPVIYKTSFGGVAGFNRKDMVLYLSPSLLIKFRKQHPVMTVFDTHRLVAHEVHHYKQFTKGLRPSAETEKYADRYSINTATKQLRRYTNEEINPLPLTSLGSYIVAGLGFGIGGTVAHDAIRHVKKRAKKNPLTVRSTVYRGRPGYSVRGKDADGRDTKIFFGSEQQAREYVRRVRANEHPEKVLADIWGVKKNPTHRDKLVDKYIKLERQLDTASDRRGRTIEHELGRLEMKYGITTDEVKQRRKELREIGMNPEIATATRQGLKRGTCITRLTSIPGFDDLSNEDRQETFKKKGVII